MSLSRRSLPLLVISETHPAGQAAVHAFISLTIIGTVLVCDLLVTLLVVSSTRLKRDATLINAFAVLVFVGITNGLYWVAHRGTLPMASDNHRDAALCLTQACLEAGAQSAQAAAVLAVILKVWLSTLSLSSARFHRLQNKWITWLLLALPWICILAFVAPVIHLAKVNGCRLQATPFYCQLIGKPLMKLHQGLAAGLASLSLLIEGRTIADRVFQAADIRLTWSTSSSANSTAQPKRKELATGSNVAFAVRVSVFVMWTISQAAFTLFQTLDPQLTSPVSDMAFACVPIVAFICFDGQHDFLRAWRLPTSPTELKEALRICPKRKKDARRIQRFSSIGGGVGDGNLHWQEFLGVESPEGSFSTEGSLGDETGAGLDDLPDLFNRDGGIRAVER